MARLGWLVAFFLCIAPAVAFADNTPADPIIDIEPDGDAVQFFGTFVFQITASTSCTQIGQFCYVRTPSFENLLPNNQVITNIELSFDVQQGPFSVAQHVDPVNFPNAIFTTESTITPGFAELFTGSTVQHCTVGIDTTTCTPQTDNFNIGLASVALGTNGITNVTITANVSPMPEPSSAAFLLSGAAALWAGRKRFLTRRSQDSVSSA